MRPLGDAAQGRQLRRAGLEGDEDMTRGVQNLSSVMGQLLGAVLAAGDGALTAAIRVRVGKETVERFAYVDDYCRRKGRGRLNRSQLARYALNEYLPPLLKTINSGERLPEITLADLAARPAAAPAAGDVISVRLDHATLRALDQVEACARGLGRRDVNRSTIIRAALSALLVGVEQGLRETDDGEHVAAIEDLSRT